MRLLGTGRGKQRPYTRRMLGRPEGNSVTMAFSTQRRMFDGNLEEGTLWSVCPRVELAVAFYVGSSKGSRSCSVERCMVSETAQSDTVGTYCGGAS